MLLGKRRVKGGKSTPSLRWVFTLAVGIDHAFGWIQFDDELE